MWRKLKAYEKELLKHMLSRTPAGEGIVERLKSSRVMEMDDGGMGSLKFETSGVEDRHLGRTVATGEFVDEDGVIVSVALNLDQHGNLYELDMWKVDFSRLRRWPNAENVVIKQQPQENC